jgi:hypothetical protein
MSCCPSGIVNHNRSFRLDPQHAGPDVRIDEDGAHVPMISTSSAGLRAMT